MTTHPDKTGYKGPERIWVSKREAKDRNDPYDFMYTEPYVRADIHDALQSANAELVRQVDNERAASAARLQACKNLSDELRALEQENASLKGWQKHYDRATPDTFAEMKKERDRYRAALVKIDEWQDGDVGEIFRWAREAISPTANKAEE